MLPVKGALSQSSPTFGIVIFHVVGIDRGGSDVVLKRTEICKEITNSFCSVVVY
jgi:hypothetical protein